MADQLKLHDILPEDYGYVILAAVGSIFVNVWMMINVARARKLHRVKVCQEWSYFLRTSNIA